MKSVGRGRSLWGGGGQVVYYESSPVRKPRKVMVMAVQLTIPYETLHEEPSLRREDWYDDDGR